MNYRIKFALPRAGVYQTPFLFVAAFLVVLLSSGISSALNFKEITAPELKRLLDDKKDVLIINVLSKIEHSMQHIPGSINIPINTMEVTDKLPEDMNVPLVFYCLSER